MCRMGQRDRHRPCALHFLCKQSAGLMPVSVLYVRFPDLISEVLLGLQMFTCVCSMSPRQDDICMQVPCVKVSYTVLI